MAFGKVNDNTKTAGFSRYIGVGTFKVLAVNPTKKELEALYGTAQEAEPEYVSENGEGIKQARVEFHLQTNPEKCNGIDAKVRFSIFVNNSGRVSSDGKYQVIDAYGNSAWTTEEEMKAKTNTLTKKDGSKYKASITTNYRKAFAGEVPVTEFVKTLLGIPTVFKWENQQIVGLIANPADAEAAFSTDDITRWFKGDFKSLKETVAMAPNNEIQALLGVRTNNEGKQYQDVYTNLFLSPRVKDWTKFTKDLAGNTGYKNTVFEVCPMKEYVVAPTVFSTEETTTDMPSGYDNEPASDMSDMPW